MGAIGAGLAVWGAWACVSALLRDRDVVAREQNIGCALLLAVFAVSMTAGLIDAIG